MHFTANYCAMENFVIQLDDKKNFNRGIVIREDPGI